MVILGSFLLSVCAKHLPDIFQLSSAAEYWFYFILGVYVNRYFPQLSSPKRRCVDWVAILLCAAILLLRVFLDKYLFVIYLRAFRLLPDYKNISIYVSFEQNASR